MLIDDYKMKEKELKEYADKAIKIRFNIKEKVYRA